VKWGVNVCLIVLVMTTYWDSKGGASKKQESNNIRCYIWSRGNWWDSKI